MPNPNIFSIYDNFLKTVIYSPITNWQRAFSPTFNFFGRNVGDVATEQHVLNEVGSYGMQLNRVLNVLSVLISRMDKNEIDSLLPQEHQYVDQFMELARAADKAATEFQDKSRHGITLDNLNYIIEELHSLEKEDQKNYNEFVEKLHAEFPLPKK